ncbi:CapA family protein [Ideonella sp. DXS22W]|uniref:CapA family protein n=1 Tax=Pseudaquabacterium inlustre TaxID=2984192 RepID=A0ABU9CLP4_9BURK
MSADLTDRADTPLDLHLVGDIILDVPGCGALFEPAHATLASADVLVGHVEVPHTHGTATTSTDVPAPPADPAHLRALAEHGFHVATLAGNHIADCGAEGIADTVATLRGLGLATTGAGMNLREALAPAVLQRRGQRVGVLSWNCVGPRESWATSRKAGAAWVKVLTHYELDYANPGGPPNIYTFAAPDSLDAMAEAVAALARQVDVVVVALHKGCGHTPARIEHYEFGVARAAIDAGAHVVAGHHAHILRGIEVYRGRPIFHGLGNFVTVTQALSVKDNDSPERLAWAKRREALFGFSPDPAMPSYPFHPESRHTAIARCRVSGSGASAQVEAGFIPCYIDTQARPVPLGRDAQGQATADYIADISRRWRLHTRFEWTHDGSRDWVRVLPAASDAPPAPR